MAGPTQMLPYHQGEIPEVRGEEGPDGSDLRLWSSNPEESQHNRVWKSTEAAVVTIEQTLKTRCDENSHLF